MRLSGGHIALVGILVGLFGIMVQQIVVPFVPNAFPVNFSHWAVIIWLLAYVIIAVGAITSVVGVFSPEHRR